MTPITTAMAEIVDLAVADTRWDGTGLAEIAPRAAEAALVAAGIERRDVEVAVLATSDAEIATLNSVFRGKSGATNVLSWPALDLFPGVEGAAPSRDLPDDPFGEIALGDIALAYETVTKEAREGHISADDHIYHLILHGCLHLLGYDHQTEADACRMEALEVAALGKAGIASPYE